MAQGKSEAAPASPDVLQVQHQIRANASELQDYFADLYKWEKTIGQEEAARKLTPSQQAAVPLPRGRTAVAVSPTSSPATKVTVPSSPAKAKRADAHTHDIGYKKWDKFDVDAALLDADDDQVNQSMVPVREPATTTKPTTTVKKTVTTKPKGKVATSTTPSKSREDIEREDGNDHYKRGDYVAAIKCYTRALGFNARNAVVLSNRAMAYLKNKEYGKAEDDCSLAFKVDGSHVKSYARRGTARNALGKHRLALLDFERALELEPKSKQIASQVTATKELMRTAIKRTPKRTQFSIKVVGDPISKQEAENEHEKSEVSLPEVPEDKENAPRAANKKITIVEESPPAISIKKVAEDPSIPSNSTSLPSPPAPTGATPEARMVSSAPLPKLPKKAAASSYEFIRVWKTFAPKGDAARVQQLLKLRADYLRMVPPASLPSVFKNSIEPEFLCELFATIRQGMDVAGDDKAFIKNFVMELPRVPRFSMVILFLSDNEKADSAWVMETLIQSEEQTSDLLKKLQALKPLYGLK